MSRRGSSSHIAASATGVDANKMRSCVWSRYSGRIPFWSRTNASRCSHSSHIANAKDPRIRSGHRPFHRSNDSPMSDESGRASEPRDLISSCLLVRKTSATPKMPDNGRSIVSASIERPPILRPQTPMAHESPIFMFNDSPDNADSSKNPAGAISPTVTGRPSRPTAP